MIEVLDKGYVKLVKHMGDDLDVANSARVSFMKESATFEERDASLIRYLMREGHTSVLRHSALTFEVYAPLMTARQWFKYVVASAHTEEQSGWNESSRRYVTENVEFYVPTAEEWRSAPENKKQGSGEPVGSYIGSEATVMLADDIERQVGHYEWALENGICVEQARLFLPAYGLYVRWRWTVSLGALMHFLHERLGHGAQSEITEYAVAVKELTSKFFPVTMDLIP